MKRDAILRSRPAAPLPGGLSAPACIGFRLDESDRQLLAQRAAQLGLSPHALARSHVLELLHAPEDRARLRQAVQQLDQELKALHADLLAIAEALLVSAGHVTDKDARAWMERNFQ